MAPKAKNVASFKWSRKGEDPVERYGWEWFECQRKLKYMINEYDYEVRLQSQFPVIYQTVLELGLRFIFDHPGDCNLSLVCEFYANWLTETKNKIVPIRAKDVKFNATILNEFLGTPNYDFNYFNTLKDKAPYRDIQHTLCGVESTARVWLKIMCSVLLPAKHLTEVTRDRVVLFYMLRKGMPIIVGVILRQNMIKFRNNIRWRLCYGGLITRFLRAQGIEEKAVDLTIAFHPDLMERQARDDSSMARMFGMTYLQLHIGGRPVTDDEMETMMERYPLTESAAFLCRIGPAFLEPLDDDEATDDEAMNDEEDDVVDEEANALMES
ncbi:hypothetical protein H5410_030901 [Solanum commersonii]|uniref:Putative plant transposon protein domain-containing protein n=1 Tax=Solanum commersonii TaxID=4109 RepID=A0A9J5YFL5_SOLCO|nr:hypothetical protein H5410_030901 [Solanum commersonii]